MSKVMLSATEIGLDCDLFTPGQDQAKSIQPDSRLERRLVILKDSGQKARVIHRRFGRNFISLTPRIAESK